MTGSSTNEPNRIDILLGILFTYRFDAIKKDFWVHQLLWFYPVSAMRQTLNPGIGMKRREPVNVVGEVEQVFRRLSGYTFKFI